MAFDIADKKDQEIACAVAKATLLANRGYAKKAYVAEVGDERKVVAISEYALEDDDIVLMTVTPAFKVTFRR